MSSDRLDFIDTTLRDGNQSLWGATGLRTGMMLEIAPDLDRAGYRRKAGFVVRAGKGAEPQNRQSARSFDDCRNDGVGVARLRCSV